VVWIPLLALLSTKRAFDIMSWDTKDIVAITMAGFGTTTRTKNNATKLSELLGVTLRTIDIKDISLMEFELIGHDPKEHTVTYENVQARVRTSILMNTANRENGLVIGTGDLSEIALGWSTYNGDHMSSYALNGGIPKTLIKYIIEYYKYDPRIADIIDDILDTPISPELLPHQEDNITQRTEDIIGSYELHDFFLYHFIKYGATKRKFYFLQTTPSMGNTIMMRFKRNSSKIYGKDSFTPTISNGRVCRKGVQSWEQYPFSPRKPDWEKWPLEGGVFDRWFSGLKFTPQISKLLGCVVSKSFYPF